MSTKHQSIAIALTGGSPKKIAAFSTAGGLFVSVLYMVTLEHNPISGILIGANSALLLFITLMCIRVERMLGHTHTQAIKASERAGYGQAMPKLYKDAELPYPLVPLDGWSLEPTGFVLLKQLIEEKAPTAIVEFGSGASTCPLAYWAKQTGSRFYSIEENAEWTSKTKQRLRGWGLDENCVHHVPVERANGLQSLPWYDQNAVEEVLGEEEIGLILIDGPTVQHGRHIRRGAFDCMKHLLADDATLVLDDYNREGEQEIVQAWKQEAPDATVRTLSGEKDIAIFQL